MVDGLTTMFFIYYCLYITKYWQPWFVSAAILETAALLGLLLVPESPEFLYAKGRYDEAEQVVMEIARFNGYTLQPDQVSFKPQPATGNPQDMVLPP